VSGAGATYAGGTASAAGVPAASGGLGNSAVPGSAPSGEDGPVAVPRGPRPAVEPGLPIAAYTDDQLDELVGWIQTDRIPRDDAQLAAALRAELGVTKRGTRVDTAVRAAVRRARA